MSNPLSLFSRKKKPIPKWFKAWISKSHAFPYRGVLIPNIKMTIEAIGSNGNDVGIAFHINDHRIYGYGWSFPSYHGKQWTKERLWKYDFDQKLSRHLNMLQKGTSKSNPLDLKTFIDSAFKVNCQIIKGRMP